jgi:hypothetical protein
MANFLLYLIPRKFRKFRKFDQDLNRWLPLTQILSPSSPLSEAPPSPP